MIWFLRAARSGVIWIVRNPQLAVLMAVVALLAAMRIQSASLRNRLDRAKARAKELESYRNGRTETDEVDRTIGSDPAAAREFLRNRKP